MIYPVSRYNQVLSWLTDDSNRDISISRPQIRQQWGIPVPNDPHQTVYVWLDALTNYLTVCGYPDIIVDEIPEMTHIIGKDILRYAPKYERIVFIKFLRFHAVYWPAFLMAANLPLPKQIIAHAHWTVNHVKMSKSLGNVIDPHSIMGRFGVDGVRYFLLREGGLNDDGGAFVLKFYF